MSTHRKLIFKIQKENLTTNMVGNKQTEKQEQQSSYHRKYIDNFSPLFYTSFSMHHSSIVGYIQGNYLYTRTNNLNIQHIS